MCVRSFLAGEQIRGLVEEMYVLIVGHMCVCIYIYIYIGIWYTVNVCIGRVVFCCGCFGEGQCGRQNTPFSFGADSTNKPRKEKQRKAQHPEHRDRIMRTLWQLNFSCGGGGGEGGSFGANASRIAACAFVTVCVILDAQEWWGQLRV